MKRRGSAFITVVAVLALLSILMEIALQLAVSHARETKRRGDASYAAELARSGLEWARACIASGAPCDGRRDISGGVIEVSSRLDGDFYEVTARGRVVHGRFEGPALEATTRVRRPEGPATPPATPPDWVPPEPPPPEPTPGAGDPVPTPEPTPDPEDLSSHAIPGRF